MLLEHMHKKFEINRTKIKGGCQSGRKLVTHNSKSDLPLAVDRWYLHFIANGGRGGGGRPKLFILDTSGGAQLW